MTYITAPIREFAEGIYDGPHATPKDASSGRVFLGIGNVTPEGRLDLSEIKYVSEEEFPKWTKRVTPQADDVVFSYEATLHRYALIPTGFDGCLGRRMALVRPIKEKILPKYLHYYFLSPGWQAYANERVVIGATVNRLPIKDFPNFKIKVPDTDVQKKIVDILSPYDELIENNRRRIKLLEDSARLLYREWFILHRFPGSEHQKNRDGIPEGWSYRPLGDYIDVTHGYAFKGEHFSDTDTNRILLTPGNFKIGGGIKLDKLKYYQEDAPLEDNYVLEAGEMLLTMTDLSKTSDTLGLPLIVPSNNGAKFLHNQRLGRIFSKIDGHFPKHFFYNIFQDYRYRSFIIGTATGTSVKHSSPGRIKSYMALIPDHLDCELINQFDEFSRACQHEVDILLNQNIALLQARNLLLPRLMNGDIAV